MIDKIAVVTGANKGLGFAIVKGLCKKFVGTVYLTSRDEKRGQEACLKLQELGYAPKYHQLDITNKESIVKFCSFLQTENKKIQILINNAGVLFLKDATESKIYQAEFTLLVNFFALVEFTEEILSYMNNNGTIVNISSSSGHLSRIPSEVLRKDISNSNLTVKELKKLMQNYIDTVKFNKNYEQWGDSPYVVSKVGVNAYTFILNRRLVDRGIKVNCVHPGYVMSDMTRGAGTLSPEEAAGAPLQTALYPGTGGMYVWHNGQVVPWDGPDPRGYIDEKM
ncbi:unnamed protein product, partial [Brenthis ino]